MQDLIIYGAGGLARETIVHLQMYPAIGYNVIGCVVDKDYFKPNTIVQKVPLLGTGDYLLSHKDVPCLCCIADTKARRTIMEHYENEGVEFATLIYPDVYIGDNITIGHGSLIKGECSFSVDITVGKGVFMNGHVAVGHDAVIGDYVTIFPKVSISGNCIIGDNVTIGGAAYITPKRKIGANATVAAGSVVFRNVAAGTTVLGNPARRRPELE